MARIKKPANIYRNGIQLRKCKTLMDVHRFVRNELGFTRQQELQLNTSYRTASLARIGNDVYEMIFVDSLPCRIDHDKYVEKV